MRGVEKDENISQSKKQQTKHNKNETKNNKQKQIGIICYCQPLHQGKRKLKILNPISLCVFLVSEERGIFIFSTIS